MLEGAEDEVKLEIATVLKLAMLAVDKYSQTNTQPGFMTVQNGRKIKVRFEELSSALEELMKKDLVVVHRCKDCDNWAKSPKAKLGACFPKEHTCSRHAEDFCSRNYVVRSKERRSVDEALNRPTSKKRAGDGS